MAKIKNIGRDRIVEAAKTVLQRGGPGALTIKAVAAEAAVTQGTVYYYFKTKEELVSALTRSSVDEQIARFDAAFASTNDELERIERTLEAVREAFIEDNDFHRRLFGLVARGLEDEASAREIKLIMDRVSDTMDRYLREAMSGEKDLPFPVEHIGRILRAAFDGLALQSLFDPEMDLGAVFASLEAIVLALYGHGLAGS